MVQVVRGDPDKNRLTLEILGHDFRLSIAHSGPDQMKNLVEGFSPRLQPFIKNQGLSQVAGKALKDKPAPIFSRPEPFAGDRNRDLVGCRNTIPLRLFKGVSGGRKAIALVLDQIRKQNVLNSQRTKKLQETAHLGSRSSDDDDP